MLIFSISTQLIVNLENQAEMAGRQLEVSVELPKIHKEDNEGKRCVIK